MPDFLQRVGIAAALLMGGAMAGYWQGSRTVAVDTETNDECQVASTPTGEAIDYARVEAIVRRSIEASYARAGNASQAQVASSTVEHSRPTRQEDDDEERLMALDEANKRVDDALFRRVWTAEDQIAMQAISSSLLPNERDSLSQRLSIAHNAAQLEIQVFSPF